MFAFGPVPPTPPVLWKLIGQEQRLVEGAEVVLSLSAGCVWAQQRERDLTPWYTKKNDYEERFFSFQKV